MTIAKTLLAVMVAGLGALAFYAEDAGTPLSSADGSAQHYPGVGLGGLFQPLEH